MKSKTLIRIGHPAYTGDNAMKWVKSKAAAIRELRNRGMLRNDARTIVNHVMSKDYGYATVEVRKELSTTTGQIFACGLCEVFNATANCNYNY